MKYLTCIRRHFCVSVRFRGTLAAIFFMFTNHLFAQTLIWQEDFSGTNAGWTQSFTDCDGAPQSFAGVRNNRFEVNDMEGTPCCGIGGANSNIWVTSPIPITGQCVSVSIEYGFSGILECSAGGPYFACTNNSTIDNAHDQMVIDYRIDAGNWVQIGYVCGGANGTASVADLTGNSLEIRIRAACKGASEIYWFDNIVVTSTPAIALSNINIVNLTGSFTLTGGKPQTTGSNYTSVTMAMQGNPAVTATLTTAPFTHNQTVSFTCPQAGTYMVTATDAGGCSGTGTVVVGSGGGGNGNPIESGCWTWLNPSPTGAQINDLFFFNDQNGWAVGDGGTIMKTTDGGQTWMAQHSGTFEELRDIGFSDPNNGWIRGLNTLYTTNNGGVTWKPIYRPPGYPEFIYFSSSSNGIIISDDLNTYQTTDGGITWEEIYNSGTSNSYSFVSATFFSSQQGWIVTQTGMIRKTTDGGKTWVNLNSGTQSALSEVFFLDAQNGWASGVADSIFRTTDGGQTWTKYRIGGNGYTKDIFFSNPLTGWLLASDGILKTTDGGQTWVLQSATGDPNTLWVMSDQKAIAAGYYGTVLTTQNGGQTWTPQSSGFTDDLRDVQFNTNQVGWVLGYRRILKTTDGGLSWATQYWNGNVFLYDFHFADSQNGWAVGGQGLVLKTTDGGQTWTSSVVDASVSLTGVHFVTNQLGWICSSGGKIYKTLNGGQTWVQQNSTVTQNLNDIFFINSQVGWAGGSGSTFLKTTNGGTTWVKKTGTFSAVRNIYFTDHQNGFMVAGSVYYTGDGGETWIMKNLSGLASGVYSYNSVFFDTNTGETWIAGGGEGSIYGSTDGYSFTNQARAGSIQAMHFTDANNGWAVGSGGAILKYSGPSAPSCVPAIALDKKTNVPVDTYIAWPIAEGCPSYCNLYIGTKPGGSDLFSQLQWGGTMGAGPTNPFPPGDTIYVRFRPYNDTGIATGCPEFSFITADTSGCNPTSDSLALVQLFDSTNGDGWTVKTNWKEFGRSIGTWYGVTVNAGGCVTHINLPNNQLSGLLPSEINLPFLQELILLDNQIGGELPLFSNLSNIKKIELRANQFTGAIPVFDIPSLEHLHIGLNMLQGEVPNFNLPNLRVLGISFNNTSGLIPNFNMPLLEDLDMAACEYSGSLPNFSMPNLKTMNFYFNKLTGGIPLLNFPMLKYLNLGYNQLSGILPSTLSTLTKLESLLLSNNKLTGDVPNLTAQALTFIELNNNRLTFTGVPSLVSKNYPTFAYSPQDSIFTDTLISRAAGQPLTIDLGIDASLTTNQYAWYKNGQPWTPPSGNMSNSNKLIFSSLQNADAGEYHVQVTNPGASDLTLHGRKIQIQVGCNGIPAPTITGPAELCSGSVQLDAGAGYTVYNWAGPVSFTASTQQPTVNQPGTYTVTVTDMNGCTASATKSVQAFPVLGASLENTLPAACNQSNGIVTAVPLNGGGGYSFQWADLSGPGQPAQRLDVKAGNYTVTITDVNGCSAVASGALFQVLGPMLSATPQPTTCNQANGSVVLSISGGSPNYTFDWADLSGPNEPQDRNPLAPGQYNVTVTDTRGCTAMASSSVASSPPGPTIQINDAAILCGGQPVVLDAGGGFSQYKWSDNSALQTVSISNAAIYTVTVTDNNGCTGTASAAVTLDQTPPTATALGSTLNCQQTSTTLTGNSTTPGATYVWAGPNGFTSISQNPTVNTPGTYTLTVTGPNGCTATATAVVSGTTDLPSATASGGTLTCTVPNLALMGSSSLPATYAWAGPNGFTSISQNPTVNTPGTYTLTVTSSPGCTATATAVVSGTVDLPSATASGGTLTCTMPSLALMGSSSLPATYDWAGPNGFTANGQSPTANSPGTYTLTVTSSPGCTATASVTVADNQQPPNISATGGLLPCLNPSVVLQGASSTPGATYAWVGPNGFTFNGQNPTVNSPGTYTLTVSGPNGCTATATAAATPAAPPVAGIFGEKPICPGGSAVLTATGVGDYSWAGPNGFTFNGQQPTVNTAGTYTLTVTDANGCTATATATIGAAPPLNVGIAGLKTVCPGGSTLLTASGGDDYDWIGPAGFLANGQQQMVSSPGVYTVTASNAEGCTGSSTVSVAQYPAPVALLTSSDPDNTICTGDAVTFTASGGVAYQFWLNGVAQGSFSPTNTFSPTGLSNGATIAVRMVDANTCQDSTQAGDGSGREPLTLTVNTSPNLGGWSLTRVPSCPEDPVRILINAPNLPNGAYTFDWELDNQTAVPLQQNLAGGVGVLDLGVLPTGFHLGRISNIGLSNGGCTATPPSGSSVSFEVKPLIATTVDTTVCQGQPVKVGTQIFTQSGAYTVQLQSKAGCDSTVTLQLKAVATLEVKRTVEICAEGTYVFYGDTLDTGGFYQKTVPGPFGCDSLIQLYLSEFSPSYEFKTETICPGAAFSYGDSVFTKAGNYQVVLLSKDGCDSATLVLTLKIAPISVSFGTDEVRTCQDEPVQMQATAQNCTGCKYTWSTGASGTNLASIFAPQTSTTASYSVTVRDNKGCTASDTLLLTVVEPYFIERDTLLCPGESLNWCGKNITQTSEHVCTYTSVEGCDSTVTLRVDVFKPEQFQVARDTAITMPPDEKSWAFNVSHGNYPADYVHVIRNPPPAKGTVTVQADQRLLYTPDSTKRSGTDVVRFALCPPANCPDECSEAVLIINLEGIVVEEIEKKAPNLITPNGDGLNDFFNPLNFIQWAEEVTPDPDKGELWIYNRWGELLRYFEDVNPSDQGWDGKDQKGNDLPQAPYYYWLKYEIGSKPFHRRGPVNLLR